MKPNETEWNKFVKTRKIFRKIVNDLENQFPKLKVVYNNALDEITCESEIKLILVGDNPGRRELEHGRYLVGPSGKIAARFFRENPSLEIDFYKNVIILNKTPIHTNRTNELKELCKSGGADTAKALEESQKKMAHLLFEFHKLLDVPVYIIGYCEMKKKGLFEIYTEELKRLYSDNPQLYKKLFFYRHFSMNQFTVDLKKQTLPGETVKQSLKRIGTAYRQRILS